MISQAHRTDTHDRRRLLTRFVGCLIALVIVPLAMTDSAVQLSVGQPFTESVDLEQIRVTAVQEGGRLKTFDSLARERLKQVNRSRSARSIDPVLLYLDMMLVPEHYASANVIHIRKKPFRMKLTQAVRSESDAQQRRGVISDAELERIDETGLVSPMFLDHPVVRHVLGQLEQDIMRTGKEVDKLRTARTIADARVLRAMWRVVPPPGGGALDEWMTIEDVAGRLPDIPAHAAVQTGSATTALEPQAAMQISRAWTDLSQAWRFQDAAAASQALNTLASSFASVEPALYPEGGRLSWEHWYYRNNKLTRTWLLYFLALAPLLMAIAYGFRWARILGLTIFVIAFALHTFSLGLRWYLAGRIPNANMFEAVISSAWFGCLVALVLEYLLRRWPVKNLSALAASMYAMFAMMLGNFMPVWLDSDIGVLMPVLDRTIWLYIHTNIIIASYALIFFAAVTAVGYLLVRLVASLRAGGGGAAMYAGASDAVIGGAASIILGRKIARGGYRNAGLATSLDGATMIFLELAFLSLWVGTLLGAVWADVSWGRPWGWDPKEVFALNTWIVFLLLLHIRLKVKDKGFWTAILAIVGCAVMLFNWIAVNFVIVGLHSYA
ncbi:MAG: cytochrome c biogenesis protein CcsA [Acidobacteriota bacterium]|nr:MAG: cytochrome c biogenesis protein CcsA [Acidobacteriota bacterium]